MKLLKNIFHYLHHITYISIFVVLSHASLAISAVNDVVLKALIMILIRQLTLHYVEIYKYFHLYNIIVTFQGIKLFETIGC